MTALRKLRTLVVAVSGLAALFVVAGRWASRGRNDVPLDAAPVRAQATGVPGALPDLSFYSTLGGGRTGSGAADEPDSIRPTSADRSGPAGGAFVVQALATRDPAEARRMRDRLVARGLPAVLTEERRGRQAIYTVRVGRYADRQGAEAVARALRSVKGVVPWILRDAPR